MLSFRQWLIFTFTITTTASLFSQHEITAVFTDKAPIIDGRLAEEVWEKAFLVNNFIQREPTPGAHASEKTEFYFLFDRNYLYVGIRCFQKKEDITAKEMARDVSLGQDDRIQVILDTYANGRDGYWFQIGPRGSIGDALVNENGLSFNKSWDGLWEGKAEIQEDGWTAEMAIPFKTIGFDKNTDSWGIKLIRYIKKNSETSYWPETSLNANRFQISDAGKITGLKNISQGIGLDIVPFLSGGFNKSTGNDPLSDFDAGIDLFYQITPSLKAALTINTDFAQTEVDKREINLTRFDLYFPEKRDFFLDGANYFNFGIGGESTNPHSTRLIPFFSRKIGLDITGNKVPIEYGGKFTGRIGKWNLGTLHIKDKNEFGNPGYSVVRVSRDIGKQSYVGLIGTDGQSFSEMENQLAGFDLRLASSEIKGNKNLVYSLYGLKSFSQGLEGSDAAFGTELNYPNDFFNFRLGYMQIGENFIPGLGFLPRANIRNNYGSFSFGPRPDKKWKILQLNSGISYFFISDLKNGGLLSSEVDFNLIEINFLSGDQIMLASHIQYEQLEEDFSIYNGIIIPIDTYRFGWNQIGFKSAARRNFWIGSNLGSGSYFNGNRTDWVVETGYKVIVPVFIGMESDRRYVKLDGGNFVAQIWRLNLNVLISPDITWYNFAQYDSESESYGWQSRFQWIIKPGKEIFLVWNSPYIDPMERFRPEEYDARLKLKYTIRF